jgi:hypothetical protein
MVNGQEKPRGFHRPSSLSALTIHSNTPPLCQSGLAAGKKRQPNLIVCRSNGNCYVIGFDRSALTARPATNVWLRLFRVQNLVNVNVRFMAKVFWSCLSKFGNGERERDLSRSPWPCQLASEH